MRALVLVALLAACSKPNPYYCDDHPDDNCLIDAGVDAPQGPQGCTTAADCGGVTPVCSAANVCIGCTSHGQCGSAVCLGDGSCANQTDVAYVAPTGDDTGTCTKTMPCRTIAFALALAKPRIKIQGNLDEAVVVTSGTVHFHAEPGTTLRRSQSPGPIFEARGAGTIVSLADVIVRDASGSTGSGISVPPGESVELALDRVFVLNNAATGINVQGGKLTMSRSVVSGNSLGGAIISGGFTITNSLFVANGNGVSTTGGLTLTPQTTGSTFKFNTVAANLSSASSATVRGINCTLPMAASNTIVAGNAASANCTFQFSLFDTGTPAATNIVGDPMFKNIDALDPMAPDYFHIQPTSAAVDQADPASTMLTDIDGDSRPNGSAPDIGADELD